MYGGPADDQSFSCARAPRLLRVVQAQGGRWDCLDRLDDEPRPRETIHLYEQFRFYGGAFMCPGGYQELADYRHIISARPRTPLDALLRARASWRRFAAAYFGVTLGADGEQIADVIALSAAEGGQ
jgi:hypothetical protein